MQKRVPLCGIMLSGWFLLTFASFICYLKRRYRRVFPLDPGKWCSSSSAPVPLVV